MKMKNLKLGFLAGLVLGLLPFASVMAGNVDIDNKAGIQVSVNTRAVDDQHTVYVDAGKKGQEIQLKLKAITVIMVGVEPTGKPFKVIKNHTVALPSMMKNYTVVVSGNAETENDVVVTETCPYPVCP